MSLHLTLLTGGSRGMGLAMAKQLLQPGSMLVSIARTSHPDLPGAASAQGALLEQWQQDLSRSEEAAQRLTDWLTAQDPAHFASVTLINNAGMIPRIAPLSASAPGDLARALRVGLEAPMLLAAAFLGATENWCQADSKPMVRKLLNISSGLGRRAMASQAAYCAAKAGMDHFTRCVALDEALKPHGAKVCSLAPGVIDTDMQIQLRSTDPMAFPDVANFAHLKTAGQLMAPAEAAAQVLAWLAHDDFGATPVADVRNV